MRNQENHKNGKRDLAEKGGPARPPSGAPFINQRIALSNKFIPSLPSIAYTNYSSTNQPTTKPSNLQPTRIDNQQPTCDQQPTVDKDQPTISNQL